MRLRFCTGILLLAFIHVRAQKAEHTFSVRNAFEDPTETANPATVYFTLPDTGKSSYLINLGVTYTWEWSKQDSAGRFKQHQVNPFFVFNRNTMIDSEQYNYKIGGAYSYEFGKQDTNQLSIHNFNSTFQYIDDIVDTSQSFLVTAYWTYFYSAWKIPRGKVFINNYKEISHSQMFYDLQPNVGLEFQDIFKATKNSTGFQSRIYLKPAASIAWRHPAKTKKNMPNRIPYEWPKKLELTITYIARYCFINTVKSSPNYIPLFNPALTYYPTDTQKFSFSLTYSSGADPVAGLIKQKYLQFAVQLTI